MEMLQGKLLAVLYKQKNVFFKNRKQEDKTDPV
jgi:hypothetical protein